MFRGFSVSWSTLSTIREMSGEYLPELHWRCGVKSLGTSGTQVPGEQRGSDCFV